MFPSARHFKVECALKFVGSCPCQFFVFVRKFSVYPRWNRQNSPASGPMEFTRDFSKSTSSLIGAGSFSTALVDQGHDPRLSEHCKRSEAPPVEGLLRYVANHTQTIQLLRRRSVGPNQWAAKLLGKDGALGTAPNVVKLIFGRRRSARMR